MITTEDIFSIIKPGQTWRIFFFKGNRNNTLIHIRAVVDNEYFVVRKWRRGKGWIYTLENPYYFEILLNDKKMYEVKK
jgi:hypothetical protein